MTQLREVSLSTMRNELRCTRSDACEELYNVFLNKHLNTYIGDGKPVSGQIVAAVMELEKYRSSDVYRYFHNNHRRNIDKAKKRNYYCKPFSYLQFVPDIYEVNTSKPERTGRPMSPQYLRTIDEMGGAPYESMLTIKPDCPVHYDYWWGVFKEVSGRYQGSVQVNEQLLGYVKLRRHGDYAFYAQILGHGDYLKDGVMHLLHYELVTWALTSFDDEANGLTKLIYAGYNQGLEGLQRWKRRALFEPALLYTDKNK